MAEGPVEVVLFDLGGVLVDVRGVGPMRLLSRIDDDEELWRRWLSCSWVRRFERGHCSADDFAAGIVDDWQLGVAPAEFLERFSAWPEAPFPGAGELVESVRAASRVGCLSNTNAVHWERFSQWPMLQGLDHTFLSFELGLVKPDPETFEHVAEQVAAPRDRVLFLDDNLVNVDAATAAGFAAAHVRGIDEASRALVAAGVLQPLD